MVSNRTSEGLLGRTHRLKVWLAIDGQRPRAQQLFLLLALVLFWPRLLLAGPALFVTRRHAGCISCEGAVVHGCISCDGGHHGVQHASSRTSELHAMQRQRVNTWRRVTRVVTQGSKTSSLLSLCRSHGAPQQAGGRHGVREPHARRAASARLRHRQGAARQGVRVRALRTEQGAHLACCSLAAGLHQGLRRLLAVPAARAGAAPCGAPSRQP